MQPDFATVSPPVSESSVSQHPGTVLLAQIDAELDPERKMELILSGRELLQTLWDTAAAETAPFVMNLFEKARNNTPYDECRYRVIVSTIKFVRHIAARNREEAVTFVSQIYVSKDRDLGALYGYMEKMLQELQGKSVGKVANPDALLARYE
jgi:hypothetical protein